MDLDSKVFNKMNEIEWMNNTDTIVETTKSKVNIYEDESDSLQLTVIISVTCSVVILGLAMLLYISLKYCAVRNAKREKATLYRTIYNPIYKPTVEVDIERTAGMFRNKSCDSFGYFSFPANFLNTQIVSLSQATFVVPVSKSTGSLKTEEAKSHKENESIKSDETFELIYSKVDDADENKQKINITESPFEHAGYGSFDKYLDCD